MSGGIHGAPESEQLEGVQGKVERLQTRLLPQAEGSQEVGHTRASYKMAAASLPPSKASTQGT